MAKLRLLLYILATSIFIASFGVNAATAADQICFRLLPPEGLVGSGPTILKLGVMDYGNNHFSLAGTDSNYVVPNFPPVSIGLVHGNAEIIDNEVEVSLSGTLMSSDNKTVYARVYHLRMDPTTGSGIYTTYTLSSTGGATPQTTGSANVVSCDGY